jgi:hypothetical protein
MVRFSARVRAATGANVYLDEVERRYARCRDLIASEVPSADAFTTANTPLKVSAVFQTGLRRAVELTESFVAAVNDGRSGADTPQALLDTANVLKDLQLRVERVVEDKTAAALSDLDKRATDLLASRSSIPGVTGRDEASSTVTGIDRSPHDLVKTAVYVVRLGLLLIITAVERHSAVRDEFIRVGDDLEMQTRGGD